MKVGSICSGIGGLDLAVETFFGAELAWYAENAEAPARVMAEHWPGIPNLGDITTQHWWDVPHVDILCGGYPCQPFSVAGKRKGVNDERHLWPHIRQAIRWIRPRYTILENVSGHRKNGFDQVIGDLAEDGLYARWVSVQGSDVGAPHERDRVFIVASNPASTGWERPTEGRLLPCEPTPDGRAARGVEWGVYGPAVEQWERLTRLTPQPWEYDRNGKPRYTIEFGEWMMGLPPAWITSAGKFTRHDALRMVGNAVVPQAAWHALSLIFGEGWP